MVNDDRIEMDDDLVKCSASNFATQVVAVGIKQVSDSFHHLVNDDNRLFEERIFHLLLSLDIYDYKLQTQARVISLR